MLERYGYDLAYGKDSEAAPGMVLFRVSRGKDVLVNINMPPQEFVQLAGAIAVVMRAIDREIAGLPMA